MLKIQDGVALGENPNRIDGWETHIRITVILLAQPREVIILQLSKYDIIILRGCMYYIALGYDIIVQRYSVILLS